MNSSLMATNLKWFTGVLLVMVFVAFTTLLWTNTASAQHVEPVACTMDAKICPDGSAVGRVAPSCEFAACPTGTGDSSTVTVQTDPANPFRVTVTRNLVWRNDPQCGPKFVGRIDWGDGVVTEQPTVVSEECGSNKYISATHTYSAAGSYTVVVTLDKVVKLRQVVNVNGGGDTNWIPPNPTPGPGKDTNWINAGGSNCGVWRLWGWLRPCDGSDAQAIPRPGDTNVVPVSPTPAPTVTGDTNWITYAPQAVSGFVKGVASAITRPVMGVIPFVKGMFGINQAEQPNSDLSGLIPMPPEGDGFKSVRTISDIKATVVNQSLTREASCQAGRGDKFEAHVVTTTDEIAIYDCATGTAPADYARVIVDVLTNQHGFAGLTVDTLLKKSFQIGVEMPRPGDTGIIKNDTTDSDTSTINNLAIGLQIKVKDKDGKLVKDWTSSSVTINSSDQIFLRWNADQHMQCLPFFADNGQYAFSRLNSNLVSGNTETEKYNLTERSGPYLLECASRVNSYDVQTAIIYVTVRSDTATAGTPIISGLPVEPSSKFQVAVSQANPLTVSITRTVPSGECGPKYVGTIDWGDGTVVPQPEAVTRECGYFTSTSATHTYKTGGQYTVSVKLDGVTAIVTQVTVFASFDAPN